MLTYQRDIEEARKNTKDKEQLLIMENLLTERYNKDRNDMLKNLELKMEEEMMPIREAKNERINNTLINRIEREKEANEKLKELQQQDLANSIEVANKKLQITSDALGAINGLVQALAKEDEASARRAFNINKGVGIAVVVL